MSDSPLHVAMLASVPFPPREGIGIYCQSLARQLVELGHRVTILTRGNVAAPRVIEERGVVVVSVPFVPAYPLHVHLHTPFLRSAIRRLPNPPDVIHAHSPLPGTPGKNAPRLITTLHSALRLDAQRTPIRELQSFLTRLQTPISARIEASLIRQSDAVALVDPAVSGYVRALSPRVRIVAMGNGVSTDEIRAGHSRREPLALYVGRLAPGKGLDVLIDAWSKVAEQRTVERLIIVGDGPLRSALIRRTRELRISASVSFLGLLGSDRRDELVALYRRAMIVVQPSFHEGLSTVVLEAMAAATPVIATPVGAHPWVITDGIDGRLIATGEVEQLAEAMVHLFANQDYARSMGGRGRMTVENRFSWRTLAQRYVDLYRSAFPGS